MLLALPLMFVFSYAAAGLVFVIMALFTYIEYDLGGRSGVLPPAHWIVPAAFEGSLPSHTPKQSFMGDCGYWFPAAAAVTLRTTTPSISQTRLEGDQSSV